ncbi:hypothetical protein THAOC_23996, partial [Thalassiosira oceanica]
SQARPARARSAAGRQKPSPQSTSTPPSLPPPVASAPDRGREGSEGQMQREGAEVAEGRKRKASPIGSNSDITSQAPITAVATTSYADRRSVELS